MARCPRCNAPAPAKVQLAPHLEAQPDAREAASRRGTRSTGLGVLAAWIAFWVLDTWLVAWMAGRVHGWEGALDAVSDPLVLGMTGLGLLLTAPLVVDTRPDRRPAPGETSNPRVSGTTRMITAWSNASLLSAFLGVTSLVFAVPTAIPGSIVTSLVAGTQPVLPALAIGSALALTAIVAGTWALFKDRGGWIALVGCANGAVGVCASAFGVLQIV